MPVDQHELREILRERSAPAAGRPIPWAALRPRARRRPALLAVAATALAIAVPGGLITAWQSAPASVGAKAEPSTGPTRTITVTPAPGPGNGRPGGSLPERFTGPDGTLYRRIATREYDSAEGTTQRFDVPLTGKPIAVLAVCKDRHEATKIPMAPVITVRVPGAPKTYRLVSSPTLTRSCMHDRAADVEPLPQRARRATVTVMGADRQRERVSLGVYEWSAPDRPAGIVPPKPNTSAGARLLASKSVRWPAQRELTLAVPAGRREQYASIACAGVLAHRLAIEILADGESWARGALCGPAGTGEFFALPARARTVTIRPVLTHAGHARLPGAMTAGLYDRPGR
ncbi:hypothetical protein [Nonomuraea longicatena]|uniref:Uncharacterized protein n=1 Tax=Nonomuraea longicatena TaxID=83682 RepID=A0ABP4AWQ2_9ACTN